MATVESQSYALPQTPTFELLKVEVDHKKEETKKTLQSTKAIIVKKVYAQAALLKSKIMFLKTIQYQEQLIAKGYDLHSTGTSKNTIKVSFLNANYTSFYGDFTTNLSV